MDLVHSLGGRLLFAIPKKGRLLQAALDLLRGADIQFHRENRLDIALVKNLPIALVFLPAADIPTFVGEGQVDLGITGLDQVQEHDAGVRSVAHARRLSLSSGLATPATASSPALAGETSDVSAAAAAATSKPKGCETVLQLGFGACNLQVQVPEKGTYVEPSDLIGKTIGTSFVHLAEEYFARLEQEKDGAAGAGGADALTPRKMRTKIIELSGSVEAACALGVADGIVDLVESGETMRAAGLKAIDTVVESAAILIKSKAPTNPELVELIASRIAGVIAAQKYVLCQYNVPRSRLAEAKVITPGKRAPTVTTLDEAGWVAVSAMVEKKKIATVMDNLVKVGATDVLVLDIHNTRNS